MDSKGKTANFVNLLPYFDAFATLDVKTRNHIITSLIEYTISDLGFDIDLKSNDIRNVLLKDLPEMVDIVNDIIYSLLLHHHAEKRIEVKLLAPFIYSINIQ